VRSKPGKTALQVCILSPHPFALTEFSRALAPPSFRTVTHHLDSMLGPELRKAALPRAPVYVVDALASANATAALMSNLLEKFPSARVLIVAEKFSFNESHDLLRLGAKGLLTYGEAGEQLPRALPLVATGGFWVRRSLLSEFVDVIITNSRERRLKVESSAESGRREQEVLDSLLDNLTNKEIASKLNISEHTVKFHVSNLLSKFGVQRRADLILLLYQRASPKLE
jgi:DNA-binding NarL/FixJ family response regulator